jgi:peptide subunit release factor RF-3
MTGCSLKFMLIWIQNIETDYFIKIVSGTLRETSPITMYVKKKNLKFSSPNAFAEKKEIVDISYPGDSRIT